MTHELVYCSDLDYDEIFTYMAIAVSVISGVKLFLWTPVRVPLSIDETDEYSLLQNSFPFHLCTQKEELKRRKTQTLRNEDEQTSPLALLKGLTFWFVLIGYAAFVLRQCKLLD